MFFSPIRERHRHMSGPSAGRLDQFGISINGPHQHSSDYIQLHFEDCQPGRKIDLGRLRRELTPY
jgi:hypothetical protein